MNNQIHIEPHNFSIEKATPPQKKKKLSASPFTTLQKYCRGKVEFVKLIITDKTKQQP